jgi:creatinine amidohydrolase/Fe(II)-dependent formamide hydrolase-like protein
MSNLLCLKNARWLLAAAALMVTAWAAAQAPQTVWLEELTWTELRDQIQAGKTTVIVPIGGTEQSGPDVALGKHNARVKVLSQRIAQRLGRALVAPVMAYVPEGGFAPPTSHMRFPGTLTVADDVFEKTLEAAGQSSKLHGFRNVVFLGDHGGYQSSIQRVVARLNKAWAGSGVRAFSPAVYYDTSSQGFARILRQHGYHDDEIGTHAGLADVSLLLAVAPSLVRQDTLASDHRHSAADGVYGGDPRRASAALGQLGVDAIVNETVSALQKDIGGR